MNRFQVEMRTDYWRLLDALLNCHTELNVKNVRSGVHLRPYYLS